MDEQERSILPDELRVVCAGPCGLEKPVYRFSKIGKETEKRHRHCMDCRSAYTRDHKQGIHRVRRGPATEKICQQCTQKKPCTDFHKSGSKVSPESRRPICKACMSENNKRVRPVVPSLQICVSCVTSKPIADFYERYHAQGKAVPRHENCRECRVHPLTFCTPISPAQIRTGTAALRRIIARQEAACMKLQALLVVRTTYVGPHATCLVCRERMARVQFAIFTNHRKICLGCYIPPLELTHEEKKARRKTQRIQAQTTYRQKYPERAKATGDRWRAKNRDVIHEHNHRRRARRHNPQFIERVYLKVLRERDHHQCGICQKVVAKSQESIDHVIPLSEGGQHSYQNCVLAHRRCNSKKGNRHNIPQQQRLF